MDLKYAPKSSSSSEFHFISLLKFLYNFYLRPESAVFIKSINVKKNFCHTLLSFLFFSRVILNYGNHCPSYSFFSTHIHAALHQSVILLVLPILFPNVLLCTFVIWFIKCFPPSFWKTHLEIYRLSSVFSYSIS